MRPAAFVATCGFVAAAMLTSTGCTETESGSEPGPYEGVLVEITDTYRLESGEELKAVATAKPLSLEAQVVARDGTMTIYPGTLSADGSRYEIAGVPEGPYWLVAEYEPTTTSFTAPNLKTYQLLTERTVDWGIIYSGRPDVAAISTPTIASVEASGLPVPWRQYTYDDETGEVIQENQDYINVYSYNADAYAAFVSPDPADPHAPLDGATSFDGWSFDWNVYASAQFRPTGIIPAVDSSQGDVLIMTQLFQNVGMKAGADFDDPWAFFLVYTAGPSCTVTPVTMQDGVAVTFSGTFVSNPTETLALDLKGSKFADELMSSVSTKLTSATLYFGVNNEPGAPFPIIGHTATLVTASAEGVYRTVYPVCYPDPFGTCDADLCPEGCDPNVTEELVLGDLAQSFEYQNPYSAHGQALLYGSVFFHTEVLHPVSQAVVRLRGSLGTMVPVADGSGKPLEPLIGLPKNLKLAGMTWPLDEPQSGLGSTFAITWEPPSFGTAESYLVRVGAWSDQDDPELSYATSALIATFRTSETSIDLPDGLLTTGQYYSVTVQADSTFAPQTPNQYASATIATGVVTSGLFSP